MNSYTDVAHVDVARMNAVANFATVASVLTDTVKFGGTAPSLTRAQHRSTAHLEAFGIRTAVARDQAFNDVSAI